MGPEHEEEELQQAESLRERSMTIKLKVENTLRWKWTKDEMGNDVSELINPFCLSFSLITTVYQRRQSNSRIIRWSDGTLSLRLGKELFDVNQSIDTSGGIPRQSVGGPQGSQPASQPFTPGGKSQGLTYLVAQHKRSQVLQSEALVTGYLTLRPTGMQSETHRMLVRAVGQKHNKIARLRMAPDPTTDPEKEKLEMMKADAKKSKRKAYDGGMGGGRKRRPRRQTQEFSDDDDADIFGSEESDIETPSAARKRKRKPTKDMDDDAKADYQEDGFVVADESDEAGSEGGGKNKVDVMEDLEKMDAQIDERDAKHRRHHGPEDDGDGDDDKDGDEGMDVESEEEEEHKVRRAGGTGLRKRQPVYEEDEDE